MPVVVRPVDSEGEAIFRLEDEIRKKREEEDEKLMEKYAQIEANYQKRLRQAIRRARRNTWWVCSMWEAES